MMENITAVLTTSALWAVVLFFVKRHADRGDQLQDRRTAGYDAVFEALALLRAIATRATHEFDYNSPPGALFDPVYTAMTKAHDVIETKRLATGPVFADAAFEVVKFWDNEVALLVARAYDGESLTPDLATRERTVYVCAGASEAHRARDAGGLGERREEGREGTGPFQEAAC